jgi:Common central domain of tyrosinase/Polyphenol oxidase middle domain
MSKNKVLKPCAEGSRGKTLEVDRRRFLCGGAALVAATGSQLFTGIPALADYAVGPTVRRNASAMSANDPILRGYRRAIKAMRALPDENPCSWFYQAAIHGTTDPRNLTAWNTCHTNPGFFWAWHRMYLYWFERIVRKHANMYDWAIPYWDWTNTAELAMPAPFRAVGDTLYDASRKALINGGAQLSTSLGASVANAMTSLDYFNAQSSMNGPHGSVHVAVGGNMSSTLSAAQDPIFWLHHSQVDRLWNLWLAQGGGRSNPVGDTTWRNTTYTFFDECCNQVSMKGCDVLRAAKQLSYSYEGEPAQVNQYCPLVWQIDPIILQAVLVRWPGPFQLRGEAVRFTLDPRSSKMESRQRLEDVLTSREHSAILNLEGVEAEVQPDVTYEVYLGPPDLKPDSRSRYFVGSFGLFSGGVKTRKHHYSPADFVFPVDKALSTVRDLRAVEVMVVPTNGLDNESRHKGSAEPRAALSIRGISIGTDRAMPQPPRDEQEELRRREEAG